MTRYDLNDRDTSATVLFILGIIPLQTLRRLAEKVANAKSKGFARVFLDIEKSAIQWIGMTEKEHPPEEM